MTNHIDTVRKHILDQMHALRSAKDPDAIKDELDRAKGISELAQVAVNTAKVEIDYMAVTKQASSPFLEPRVEVESDASTAGVPAIERDQVGSETQTGRVTREPGRTVHKLRG